MHDLFISEPCHGKPLWNKHEVISFDSLRTFSTILKLEIYVCQLIHKARQPIDNFFSASLSPLTISFWVVHQSAQYVSCSIQDLITYNWFLAHQIISLGLIEIKSSIYHAFISHIRVHDHSFSDLQHLKGLFISFNRAKSTNQSLDALFFEMVEEIIIFLANRAIFKNITLIASTGFLVLANSIARTIRAKWPKSKNLRFIRIDWLRDLGHDI